MYTCLILLPCLCTGVSLALAVFGLVVLAIAFGVTISTLKSSPSSGGGEGESNVCLTESCIHASALILGNIDRSVDPCQDFYNFTCGAWAQKTIIPSGMLLHKYIINMLYHGYPGMLNYSQTKNNIQSDSCVAY